MGKREFTFDFAEGLLQDNLLFVDRETNSVWSQLHGQAVIGPMKGTALQIVPSMQASWKFWRTKYPDTRVMIAEDKAGRPYFYRNRKPGTPRPKERPSAHDTSALGLGLARGGQAIFFPFRELERASTPLKLTVGGEEVTLHYRKEGLTAWAEDVGGNLLPTVLAYEEGWMAFNPDSEVFGAQASGP